ncbi:MAG: hypothetical protein QM530_00435 [Phycisphaerales bacterium]|nr:hypothetical protein [Phycisphaerales bacterium]
MTNHLGNVLSTISDNRYDKKLGTGSGPSLDTIKVFAPAITASYDYYPFGMLMPGRYLAADTITQWVDILAEHDAGVSSLSFMAMPTGASPLGGGSLTTLPGDALQVQADTIGDGMERPIAVTANQYTELQLDASMLLGDPMRASVYELVHDSNQVLRPCEIASSIMSIEGTYILDFTPTTSTVYLRLAYHATGQDGTTAASAGAGRAGRAGSSPTGRGFSKIVLTGHIGTEEKITRWRLVKLVKNPNDYYRFGFNGQEKVNEIYGRGTHYDFGARYYDSRVARYFSVDPLAAKAPDQTTFRFGFNSPIFFRDVDGKFEVTPALSAKYPNVAILLLNADKLYYKQPLPPDVMKLLDGVNVDEMFNNIVQKSFEKYSHLSKDQIKEMVTPHKGPLIDAQELDGWDTNDDGSPQLINGETQTMHKSRDGVTNFFDDDGREGFFWIDDDIMKVAEFELAGDFPGFGGIIANNNDKAEAVMALFSTVFHESVHYGRLKKGWATRDKEDSPNDEVGTAFEKEGYGRKNHDGDPIEPQRLHKNQLGGKGGGSGGWKGG